MSPTPYLMNIFYFTAIKFFNLFFFFICQLRRGLENRSLVPSPTWPIFLPENEDSHSYRITPLSLLSFVSTKVMRETNQWLRKNIMWSTGKRPPRDYG